MIEGQTVATADVEPAVRRRVLERYDMEFAESLKSPLQKRGSTH
jgi:hypothetical protein